MTIDEIKRQMFIDSEEVCGNTMIDTYSAQEYVERAYNKAIDDFLTDIINKINFEDKWLFDCKSNNADTNIAFSALRTFVNERAEQLKAGGKNESIQM